MLTAACQLQQRYLHDKVERAYPFMPETKERLSEVINRLSTAYAKCVTHGDTAMAQRHLKMHQREHVRHCHPVVTALLADSCMTIGRLGAGYRLATDDRAGTTRRDRRWRYQGCRNARRERTQTRSLSHPYALGYLPRHEADFLPHYRPRGVPHTAQCESAGCCGSQ